MILPADPEDYPAPSMEQWYKKRLIQHPRCNDPDHPGCPKCEGPEQDEEWKDD